MSTGALKHMSWSEYLQRERQAETRSEFDEGEVFAMADATRRHNVIAINAAGRQTPRRILNAREISDKQHTVPNLL